jgi:hypothetical protein
MYGMYQRHCENEISQQHLDITGKLLAFPRLSKIAGSVRIAQMNWRNQLINRKLRVSRR